MVFNSLEAAKLLEKKNISSSVVNMHTIKPIDKDEIKESCKSKLIVSVEEHNVVGGLGSAISEYKARITNSPKQKDLRKKIKALRKKLKMDESKMSPKELYDYCLYMRKYKPYIWKDMKKNKDVPNIMKKYDRKQTLIR